MHYLHTTLYVTDLDASVSFLENWTGLKVLRRFSMGDAHFAFLSGGEGETAVELIQGAGHSDVRYAGLSLGFAVADLDGVFTVRGGHGEFLFYYYYRKLYPCETETLCRGRRIL